MTPGNSLKSLLFLLNKISRESEKACSVIWKRKAQLCFCLSRHSNESQLRKHSTPLFRQKQRRSNLYRSCTCSAVTQQTGRHSSTQVRPGTSILALLLLVCSWNVTGTWIFMVPQHFLQEWRQQKHVVCDLGSLVCLMHPVSKGLDSVLRSNVLRVFSYWKGKFMHILGKYVLIWFACCPSFRAYFYQVSEKQDARFQRVLQLHQTWSRYQREGNSVSSAAFPVHSSRCPLQQVNKKPVGSDLLIRQ